MLIALIIITVLYLIVIGSLIYGFDKVEDFQLKDLKPQTDFSIIIPFRNEAEHLPLLLASLLKLEYSKHQYEIVFIDDDSSDNSQVIIEKFFYQSKINYTILKNVITSKSPKKDAIKLGIAQSKFNWIITTDADCRVPIYWLDAFDGFIQKSGSEFIVAPVCIDKTSSFLDRFQAIDNLSLQGTTIGSFGIKKPLLCNGANLCYKKSLFKEVEGFDGNDTIASGDDMFLMQKVMKNYPEKANYLKSEHAIVTTTTQDSLQSLMAQRMRWASKTKRYKSVFSKVVALIVVLMNMALLAGLALMIANVIVPKTWLYLFIVKSGIDFLLLFKSARFFNKEQLLLSYPFASLLYPVFVFMVTVLSSFGGYKWKERTYND